MTTTVTPWKTALILRHSKDHPNSLSKRWLNSSRNPSLCAASAPTDKDWSRIRGMAARATSSVCISLLTKFLLLRANWLLLQIYLKLVLIKTLISINKRSIKFVYPCIKIWSHSFQSKIIYWWRLKMSTLRVKHWLFAKEHATTRYSQWYPWFCV